MKRLGLLRIAAFLSLIACEPKQDVIPSTRPTEQQVIEQIEQTGLAVREAFAKGDIETIKLYHHPDVQKALGYNNVQIGREAVLEGLQKTMQTFDLKFLDEKATETFLYRDNVVIKQMRFALELIPKNGDDSFIFRGRTLLVLQRYAESPTGWATIHEIIQPYEPAED